MTLAAAPDRRPVVALIDQIKSDRLLISRDVRTALEGWTPKSLLGTSVLEALPYLPPELAMQLADRIRSATVMESSLRVLVHRKLGLVKAGLIDPRDPSAQTEVWGEVSHKVVTTVGCGFIVDAFQNLVELELMKFHGIGTGSTAEAAGDTALVTELTTEYNPNSTRATGTTTEFSALVYQTVATNTLDSGTPNLREHGVFSASTVGVLLDRSVFAGIALDGTVADAITTDYRLTFTAGG